MTKQPPKNFSLQLIDASKVKQDTVDRCKREFTKHGLNINKTLNHINSQAELLESFKDRFQNEQDKINDMGKYIRLSKRLMQYKIKYLNYDKVYSKINNETKFESINDYFRNLQNKNM